MCVLCQSCQRSGREKKTDRFLIRWLWNVICCLQSKKFNEIWFSHAHVYACRIGPYTKIMMTKIKYNNSNTEKKTGTSKKNIGTKNIYISPIIYGSSVADFDEDPYFARKPYMDSHEQTKKRSEWSLHFQMKLTILMQLFVYIIMREYNSVAAPRQIYIYPLFFISWFFQWFHIHFVAHKPNIDKFTQFLVCMVFDVAQWYTAKWNRILDLTNRKKHKICKHVSDDVVLISIAMQLKQTKTKADHKDEVTVRNSSVIITSMLQDGLFLFSAYSLRCFDLK